MKTKPYRPSSGEEGEYFEASFCERCRRDAKFYADKSDTGCSIHARMLAHDEDDPKYPKQIVRDDVEDVNQWNERCTAFVPVGTPYKKRPAKQRPAPLFGDAKER